MVSPGQRFPFRVRSISLLSPSVLVLTSAIWVAHNTNDVLWNCSRYHQRETTATRGNGTHVYARESRSGFICVVDQYGSFRLLGIIWSTKRFIVELISALTSECGNEQQILREEFQGEQLEFVLLGGGTEASG